MECTSILSQFYSKAAKDNRIGIRHIALYVSLVQIMAVNGFDKPLLTFSSYVMKVAKIYSTATYHRLIKELNDYGYILYKPSFYKGKGSEFRIVPSDH